MEHTEVQRACRHDVDWPARVRRTDGTDWHFGQAVSLSVTGVLLRTERHYQIGERVEVEIDFLSELDGTSEAKTVVSGVGLIVRADHRIPGHAAVHFMVECALSSRGDSDQQATPKHA